MHTHHRAPLRVIVAALLAAAFAAFTVGTAQAASYRFWGFYQLTGDTWAFAQKGPAETVPADGSVDGWRFAVSDPSASRFPRAVLTFDQICGATPAEDGKKRVGVVVDFGRAADSADNATPPEPKAVCAVLATDASSSEALKAAGDLRVEGGLVCAVAGYPATDCGGEVGTVSDQAKAPDTDVTIAAPGAPTAATTPAPSTPAESSTTTPADSSSTAVAAPEAQAPTVADASSGSNPAAYVIAGIALLALIAFLIVRARGAAARRDA